MSHTHVIAGASLAGATAAITLRREMPLEPTPLRPRVFYADHGIETIFGTPVSAINSEAKTVTLDGRSVPFDTLLIATGVRSRRISIPGADLAGIYSLRTVQDAARIRAEMAAGRRAVVVGMGFIGSEVAASLRHAGVDVVAIDPAKTPLFRVLGETVGQRIAALHQAHGVRTILEDTVKTFEGTEHVSAVVTAKGTRIECDFVVVGIGVEPVVDFLDGSGVRVDNGVLVDEYCQTSVDGMYAAGDVANHYHPIFNRRIRVEHWQNAIKQGGIAARNMLGQRIRYDEVHWFWSDQYDVNLQYAGHHTSAEKTIVRGSLDSDSFLVCYVNDGRIDAALAFNRGKDLRRVMPLIKSRRVVKLDRLRDETVDMRSLAAA